MGRTELPFEVIREYMESLAETYTEDVSKTYKYRAMQAMLTVLARILVL